MSVSNPSGRASTSTVDDSTTPAATTAVITNENTNPFRSRSTPRPRVFNDAGVQTIKGGQQIGAGFFDAVSTAYTNLVNKPLALTCIIFSTFCFFTLSNDSLTPVALTYNAMLNTSKTDDVPYSIRSIATIFTYIFSLVLNYEFYFSILIFFTGIYLAKPSVNNRYLCLILASIAMLARFSSFELLALCHFFFMYTQVRDPSYKFLLAFVTVVCVIFGFTHMSGMTGLSGLKAVA